jgi:hypothetical protein
MWETEVDDTQKDAEFCGEYVLENVVDWEDQEDWSIIQCLEGS